MRLAFGVKWGLRGASGSVTAFACAESRSSRASQPKPAADCFSKSRRVKTEVKRLHDIGLSADDAIKQANWGAYKEWFIADQQGPIAVRKVYEELEGKLK